MSLVLNTLCMYSATENSPGRFSFSTTKFGVARTLSCRIKQTRVICMSVRLCRGASWRPSLDVLADPLDRQRTGRGGYRELGKAREEQI